jgi:hypothetical protein
MILPRSESFVLGLTEHFAEGFYPWIGACVITPDRLVYASRVD